MAADLGFVAHAAERDAHELAAEGAGDRLAERGLAHARRPDETEDRALHLFLELAHGEVFEDAFLHLFEVVVVLFEDLMRGLEVEVVLGRLAPGKFRQPFDIGPGHGRFGRVRMHAFEPAELLLGLFARLLRHLGLLDLFAKFAHVLGAVVGLAEFALDRLELLAQEVFALRLVDLAAHIGLDLLLHGEEFDLLARAPR